MFRGEANRRVSAGRWHAFSASVDSYVTRMMCGLVISLASAVGAVHLPLSSGFDSIGWYVSRTEERLTVDHLETEHRTDQSSGGLVTQFDQEADAKSVRLEESADKEELPAPTSDPRKESPQRLSGRKILDFAQKMPEIVGGLGAYYIHIEYPEAAIHAGIEGRLVLSFIVDTEGETHEIEVLQSLHPACDSAAVQALRRTRFVPGYQNGEPVQVKMRLPVRFQLLPHGGPANQTN